MSCVRIPPALDGQLLCMWDNSFACSLLEMTSDGLLELVKGSLQQTLSESVLE